MSWPCLCFFDNIDQSEDDEWLDEDEVDTSGIPIPADSVPCSEMPTVQDCDR